MRGRRRPAAGRGAPVLTPRTGARHPLQGKHGEQVGAAFGALRAYLGTLIDEKLQEPTDDLLAAADWDPEVFPDAGTLDIHRGNRHHVAFGYGAHQCIGQHLAWTELEVVFSTLFKRIPTLRVAVPPDELHYKHDGVLFGLHELPVTWQEERRADHRQP